ncbi:hypothetical protein DPMN_032927 [Dreissena polymorpha]|uniref:Uncharacterized protein n=1 Tax=Dreissena polymorpha TaxID=45954 RepID=A0A9D4M621_DREPO|nr:hypothetical protein DPMN_032927 [Dreissena polymorpha]
MSVVHFVLYQAHVAGPVKGLGHGHRDLALPVIPTVASLPQGVGLTHQGWVNEIPDARTILGVFPAEMTLGALNSV